MLLGNYFNKIKIIKIFLFQEFHLNTKSIKKNNIFFAIKGNSIDGNKFISKAIKKGSKIIVTEKKQINLKMEFCIFIQKCKKIISRNCF